MIDVPYLTEEGYRLALNMIHDDSHRDWFTDPSIDQKELAKDFHEHAIIHNVTPFRDHRMRLQHDLASLNESDHPLRGADANFAPLVHAALDITPAQATDKTLWSSLNCFALLRYTQKRWAEERTNKYVSEHWLWGSPRPYLYNASARLWWLFEISQRAVRVDSSLSSLWILDTFARNPVFYYNLMYRRFMTADPRLMATVLNMVCDDTDNGLWFQEKGINALMKHLHALSGARSFDALDFDELLQIVRKAANDVRRVVS